MSDLVGFVGYNGQACGYLDADHFGLVQGNALCVVDVEKGPREMILRTESGIACFASHPQSGIVAIAPDFGSSAVEVLRHATQQSVVSLPIPTTARVIDLVFSRGGDKLFALTDSSDPFVLCWNLATGTLAFAQTVEGGGSSFQKVIVNSGNESLFALYGTQGIKVGTISEIMGSQTVRFDSVTVEPDVSGGMEYREAFTLANTITCAIWAPFDYILMGNLQGSILEVPAVGGGGGVSNKSSLKRAANFVNPGMAGPLVPTCLALGNCTLIVCTSVGAVMWFASNSFLSKPDSQLVDLAIPLQISSVTGYISTLTVDPTLNNIVVGSLEGEISRLLVEVQARPVAEHTDDDVYQTEASAPVDDTPMTVEARPLNVYQSGAILCSSSLSIPNNTNKKHMSVFAVGTQAGVVSFWLQPFVDSDRITENIGVRRAAPRILTHLADIRVHLQSSEAPPVICSLTALHFRTKRSGQLLCVGLDNGWVEIWEIIAQVSEDEDDEEGGGSLSTKRLGMRKFFNAPVTSISASSFVVGTSNQQRHCFSVSSFADPLVFVVEVFNTMDGFAFDVQAVVKLEESVLPTSSLWTGASLWVCGSNGRLYKFRVDALQCSAFSADLIFPSAESIIDSGFDSGFIKPTVSSSGTIVSSAIGSNRLFAVVLAEGTVSPEFALQSDVVVCSAISGQYLVSGCIDGSIYIWDVGNPVLPTIVNRLHIHSGPVLTLCFSSDGSLLLSTSSDGSYFISTVAKPRQIEETIMKLNEMGQTDNLFTSPKSFESSSTWMEQKKTELLQSLKQQNESNFASVSSAIGEINDRLQKLLSENAERTELEKMDRSEFVVDIIGQDQLIAENQRRSETVRMSYYKLNSFNELIAARVRQTCWDSMSVQARCLLPLMQTDNENVVSFVSSMPIRKLTDEDALSLERIKRLRAIEMRSQRRDGQGTLTKLPSGKSRCTWSSTIEGCPETVSWLAFDGVRWPCADVIEMLAEKDKAEAEAGKATKTEAGEEEAEASLVEDEDSQVLDAERDVDDNDVFNLLYPPQCVRTQTQKRVQIHLLKEVGRIVRSKFNANFDRLVREKEDVMSSVESRNVRIRAILEELKEQDEFFEPKWKDSEISGGAITVRDDEVVNRPYESEAQRATRLREEEERRRREAEKDAEDVKGRALDEMMNGTLEVKRDVFAEASSLHRPDWMDEIAPADMTDSQLKEVEAFEVKFKALQEEQAKYRKTLEVEMKKLKAESIEVCKAFDEKLIGMVKLKVFVQKEILSQELYISRISQSMAQHDQAWQLLQKNEVELEATRLQRNQLRTKIDIFGVEVEKLKSKLSASQEDERNMEKGFKRDLQTLCNVSFDQDQLKIFSQLYRTRAYPEVEEDEAEDEAEESEVLAGGSGLAQSKGGDSKSSSKKGSSLAASGAKKTKAKVSRGGASGTDALGPMQEAAKALGGGGDAHQDQQRPDDRDPFYAALQLKEKIEKNATASIPLQIPLNMESDCPEGFDIDQFQWSKLQELRNARIEKEIETMVLSREYHQMKQKLDQLCAEESIILGCVKDLVAVKEETLARLKSLESDIVVIICLKQGQDEVDREAVVTDYSSAALIPVDVVKKFNDRIKEHGKEKVGVLNRIKQFRRKINILDWEAQHLQLESHHFEEYYTDLQLLRVTRDLQQVIRDGSNAEQAKARLDRVGMRKEFLQKDADEKIRKLRKANEALRRLVKGRSDESVALQDKILKLRGEVDARQSVLKSRDDARGTTGNPIASAQLKMKKVIAKKQLVGLARSQAEEIDFLRQELDRMRQRTFPSFVRSVKKRNAL